jgi:hypothetical protein
MAEKCSPSDLATVPPILRLSVPFSDSLDQRRLGVGVAVADPNNERDPCERDDSLRVSELGDGLEAEGDAEMGLRASEVDIP